MPPAKKPKEYVATKITNHWFTRDKWYYEVKWRGHSENESTYEPHAHLTSFSLLTEYYEKWWGVAGEEELEATIKRMMDEAKTLTTEEEIKGFLEDGELWENLFAKGFRDWAEATKTDFRRVARCIAVQNRPSAPQDDELFERGVKLGTIVNVIKLREDQLARLAEVALSINATEAKFYETSPYVPLYVENTVDLTDFPMDFTYSSAHILASNVTIPDDPPAFCTCEDCHRKLCCGELNESVMSYDSKKRFLWHDRAIFECNKNCKCDSKCRNRVVQLGRQIELIIFKTKQCGWGVKAKSKISKGTFLGEYVGELLREEDSVAREPEYVSLQGDYVFDLDFNDDKHNQYAVDATKFGNYTRFINHSCEPNAAVRPVFINCLDPSLHKLAFFALKAIAPGDELSFDYLSSSNAIEATDSATTLTMNTKTRCYCGAPTCKEWLFTR